MKPGWAYWFIYPGQVKLGGGMALSGDRKFHDGTRGQVKRKPGE
jgi:hypothetical protein